jgi:hypothetical protein
MSEVSGSEERLRLRVPFELLAATDSLEKLGFGFKSAVANEAWVERVKVRVEGAGAGLPPKESAGLSARECRGGE